MEIYLDNAATTRVCDRAVQVMTEAMLSDYGNPSSLHHKGMVAEQYVREARRVIADALRVDDKEILFTSGGTESNNMAILGGAWANQRMGKHLITTMIEHPSVENPMRYLEEHGFSVTRLPVDAQGRVDPEMVRAAVRPDTILVSIMCVNNEIGTIQPLDQIGKAIREKNPQTLFHVDAIQGFGKVPLRPRTLGIDMLSASGHKLHGPKGIGFLYIRDRVKVRPLLYGGGQQQDLRSGTENVPGIAGLGEAVRVLFTGIGKKTEELYELREYFIRGLMDIPDVRINGYGLCQDRESAPDAATGAGSDAVPAVTLATTPALTPIAAPDAGSGAASSLAPAVISGTVSAPAPVKMPAVDPGFSVFHEGAAPHVVSVSFGDVRAEVLLHALEERGIYVSSGSACASNHPAVSSTLKAIGVPKRYLDATVRFSFCYDTTREEIDACLMALHEIVPELRRFTPGGRRR